MTTVQVGSQVSGTVMQLTQTYEVSGVPQATQSAASSPLRGGSTSTGAARGLTRMLPSNGNEGQRVKSGSLG